MPNDVTQVGSLARELRERRSDLHNTEQKVNGLLESLFLGWRARFPTERGWRFTAPGTLDVYDVVPSPAATSALRRAGFDVVTLHQHRATRQGACTCSPEP